MKKKTNIYSENKLSFNVKIKCLKVFTFSYLKIKINKSLLTVKFLCIGVEIKSKKYYPDDFLNATFYSGENLQWTCYFDYEHNLTDVNYTWFKVNETSLTTSSAILYLIIILE